MTLSTLDIMRIIGAGGGAIIDCGKYSTLDLLRFADSAAKCSKRPRLIMKRADVLNPLDLLRIAEAGDGLIIFD